MTEYWKQHLNSKLMNSYALVALDINGNLANGQGIVSKETLCKVVSAGSRDDTILAKVTGVSKDRYLLLVEENLKKSFKSSSLRSYGQIVVTGNGSAIDYHFLTRNGNSIDSRIERAFNHEDILTGALIEKYPRLEKERKVISNGTHISQDEDARTIAAEYFDLLGETTLQLQEDISSRFNSNIDWQNNERLGDGYSNKKAFIKLTAIPSVRKVIDCIAGLDNSKEIFDRVTNGKTIRQTLDDYMEYNGPEDMTQRSFSYLTHSLEEKELAQFKKLTGKFMREVGEFKKQRLKEHEIISKTSDIDFYPDAVDLVPRFLSKYSAVSYLISRIDNPFAVLSSGDNIVDFSMWEAANDNKMIRTNYFITPKGSKASKTLKGSPGIIEAEKPGESLMELTINCLQVV